MNSAFFVYRKLDSDKDPEFGDSVKAGKQVFPLLKNVRKHLKRVKKVSGILCPAECSVLFAMTEVWSSFCVCVCGVWVCGVWVSRV